MVPTFGRFFLLLAVGVCVGLLVMLIVGVVQRKRRLAIGSGVALGLLLLLPASLAAYLSVQRVVPDPREQVGTSPEVMWQHFGGGLSADIQPTRRDAAVALGHHFGLQQVADDVRLELYVLVEQGQEDVGEAFANAYSRSGQREPRDVRIEASSNPNSQQVEADADTVVLRLHRSEIAMRPVPWDGPERWESGVLHAVMEYDGEVLRERMPYAGTPWVDSDSAIGHDGRWWAVARSHELAATAEDALEDAVRYWGVAHLREALSRIANQRSTSERLRAAIDRHDLVADTFVQRIERDYGDVYRAAALIDISDEPIHAVAADLMTERQRRMAQLRSQGFAMMMLIVVLLGVYGFLQAATRGYYTWVVRGLMVIVFVVGAFAALVLVA